MKSFLDLKDEQLAVQMDAHDSLWGETGAFLLSVTKIYLSHLFLSVSVVLESRSRAQVLHVRLVVSLSCKFKVKFLELSSALADIKQLGFTEIKLNRAKAILQRVAYIQL